MKIYLAGVPGGGLKEDDIRVLKYGTKNRLITFYYKKHALQVISIIKNELLPVVPR